MILDEKLAAGDVIVLDGATGTEVARLGGEMNAAAPRHLALSHQGVPVSRSLQHRGRVAADRAAGRGADRGSTP